MSGQCISTLTGIVDELAKSLEQITSDNNYSQKFLQHKSESENESLDFTSDNLEPYNQEFTVHELQIALNSSKATAPEPDHISNLILKKMPENAQEYMLKIFNKL